MTWQIDRSLHWTDHYVEYGFAKIDRAVGPEFTEPALAEVRRILGHENRPLNEWTSENTPTRSPVPVDTLDVLPKVYDQPGVRDMLATMFGALKDWNGERKFQLFLSAYDEKAQQVVRPTGHIDFVNTPVPVFGSGFVFQVSLVKSEPFSGNLSLYPGTHKVVQRTVMENPDFQYPKDLQHLIRAEPFEFVAEPGDIVLFHHLVGHGGNSNHATHRSPRVTLHCQGLRRQWLREIDPADCNSTWARSLATNGPYRARADEEQTILDYQKAHPKRREKALGATAAKY